MACIVMVHIGMAYTVMAYLVMAYIVMAYIVMAHIVMASDGTIRYGIYIGMTYIDMPHIVMAYIVMVYIVMASISMVHVVMACIVMAYTDMHVDRCGCRHAFRGYVPMSIKASKYNVSLIDPGMGVPVLKMTVPPIQIQRSFWVPARPGQANILGTGTPWRDGHFEYRHGHTRAMDMPSAMPRCL